LSTLTNTLESSASSLKDSSLYQKRTVSGNNSGVEVIAETGVAVQNFSISDVSLAKTNVIQSGSFTSRTSLVASGSGTFNINIDGTDYKIDYDGTTTLEDLQTKINDIAGDKVTASILQINSDSYSMVFNSENTGKTQQISIVDFSGNLDSALQSDVLKSDAFTAKTDTIASTSGSMTLSAGGNNFTFNYDTVTTLDDLAKMINNDAGASQQVYASVIKNNNNEYNLVLTAKNPAENQSISISDNNSGLDTRLTTNATSVDGNSTEVQTSSDSSFKYNGIALTRSSNTIDDIKTGITIKLLEDNASANISISQDTQPIKDELQNFVDSYNNMQKQLDYMTLADLDENKVGIFNGDNSINAIGRNLRRIITSRDSDTNQGLSQYGIEIDRTGKMSFNSSIFDEMTNKDAEGVAQYFSGKTTVNNNDTTTHKDGIFEKLYDNLSSLTSYNGTLTTISDGLSRDGTKLEDSRVKALDLLNSRYDSMTSRFIEYDAMINRMNNSFSALQQQIEMSVNGNN